MEFAEIKEIMQLFAKSKIQYLHIEREGFCFKMKQDMAGSVAPIAQQIESMAQPSVGSIPVTLPAEPAEDNLLYVTSPIVGTFYAAPNPQSEPFVKVGQHVSPGQTLCIIEAMKLMNEIQSEYSGEIVKILVENAQPVEFGQKIFAIKSV
ncbi:MAG: acetyl-CoA carboxylase biotin carboxyl carrier protein [Acidobacteria bacterium]|nr:acetyl-CoA carboxylase biotin carboxyl carrier protein [Acidobacteriota bacterium]MCB9396916.1 acetyl-CoA carboxylase biotin carboxyl carrier protein [Acidobacteriota bacterium]